MHLKTFLSLLAGVGAALVHSVRADSLEVGAEAPGISCVNQDGETVNLADAYAKGLVLVYFYPKADTPGCTKQACSLRDAYTILTDRGVTVFGVSMDTPEAQKAFQEKYNLPFTLIADPEGKVVEAFGVSRRGQFSSRQAFLIDGGKVIWRDTTASTAKQAEDVLAVLDARDAQTEAPGS